MENKLKPVTKEIIKDLNDCKIRTIMATGDNTLTAISVGRDCNILDKEQQVYFGDIKDDKVVWKSARALEVEAPDDEVSNKSEIINQDQDDTRQVPWDGLENKDQFGVALNGKTLSHLYQNRE